MMNKPGTSLGITRLSSSRLVARIEQVLHSFSQNDRRIADHLLLTYPNAAWQTVEAVAEQVGVSKSAVVRFASKLGYEGFAELQRDLQAELSDLLVSPLRLMLDRNPPPESAILEDMVRRSCENLEVIRQQLSVEQLCEVADRMATCEGSVYLIGFSTSYGLAYYAHGLLSTILSNVMLLAPSEVSLPESLATVSRKDVVLGITARRYARATLRAFDYCHEAGAYVIAITDTLTGPATPRADRLLVGVTSGVSMFDSRVPFVFLIEAIVNAIALRHKDRITGRLERVEDLIQKFQVFEAMPDGGRFDGKPGGETS